MLTCEEAEKALEERKRKVWRMKIIPNWKEKKLRCHFCGETRSVKYTVYLEEYEFHDDVPCCNKCALLFDHPTEKGGE